MDEGQKNVTVTDDGTTTNTTTEPATEPVTEPGTVSTEPESFDDVLKNNRAFQAEFDRRVNAAVKTGVSNAQKKWETITNDKITEAEKMAVMSKAEKTEYLQRKREHELEEREARINRLELESTAKDALANEELPTELADILNYRDQESYEKSLQKVTDCFHKALSRAISDLTKGGEPIKKAGEPTEADMAKEVADAIASHI